MKVAPYARVSTEGQDPEVQFAALPSTSGCQTTVRAAASASAPSHAASRSRRARRAWCVGARLAEQPRMQGISTAALVAGGATAVAVGVVAGQHPATRAAATRAVQKGRELAQKGGQALGEVLTKLLTPPPAPPAPPTPAAPSTG